MKIKLAFLFLMALSPLQLEAQTIDGVKISELESDHIIIRKNYFSFKAGKGFGIAIDYGQGKKGYYHKKNLVKGEDGAALKFASIIEALNLMDKQGYEVVSSFTEVQGGSGSVEHILRRKRNLQK